MKKESKKLPKQFKEKWIKALRSGKFNQTDGKLYATGDNGYCCLGVAGSICGISNNDLKGNPYLETKKFGNVKNLPKLIMGDNYTNDIVAKLANYNDHGRSFKWIASYIERYL